MIKQLIIIFIIVVSDLQANITKKEENYLKILEAKDFKIESNLKTVNQVQDKKISLQNPNPDDHKKISLLSKFKFSVQQHKL